jgi:hypothetical protein
MTGGLTAVFPIQKAVLKVVAVCQYRFWLAENRTIKSTLATTLRNNPMALKTSCWHDVSLSLTLIQDTWPTETVGSGTGFPYWLYHRCVKAGTSSSVDIGARSAAIRGTLGANLPKSKLRMVMSSACLILRAMQRLRHLLEYVVFAARQAEGGQGVRAAVRAVSN